jgi:hypothetical protein
MRVKLQLLPACLALFILIGNWQLQAQEIDFLPGGVFSTSYEYKSGSADSILSGMERKSMGDSLLDRQDIDEAAVDGSVSIQTGAHLLKLHYGLSDSFNISFTVPYLYKRRTSSLTVSGSGNAAADQFVENNGSAETQGLGDLSLTGMWRPIYTDGTELRLAIGLDGNNGAFYYNDGQNISLGNGAYDSSFTIRWLIYPITSNSVLDFEASSVFTSNATVTSGGEELELQKDNSGVIRLDFSVNHNAWNFGGGLKMVAEGQTAINGISQGDGYLAYTYRLFLNYGNLNQLEHTAVGSPWLVGVYLDNTVFGANAPEENTIGFKAVFYF